MKTPPADQNFNAFIEKEEQALVWFGVDWCGNCRRLEPVLEELAQSLDISLYKIVVDDSPEAASQCGVNGVPARYDDRGVPTVIVFESGKEKGRVVGSLPEEKIVQKVAEIVAL